MHGRKINPPPSKMKKKTSCKSTLKIEKNVMNKIFLKINCTYACDRTNNKNFFQKSDGSLKTLQESCDIQVMKKGPS